MQYVFDTFRNSSQIAPLTPHSPTYFDKRQFSSKSIESSIASSKALGQNPLAVVASLIIAY
jgi:xanthine dehydrogenase molybdopterin-binding subunit B